MRKEKYGTVMLLGISFFLVLGGWFLLRHLLNKQEKQILEQSGQIAVQSVQREEQESAAEQKQETTTTPFAVQDVSEQEMEQILLAWENSTSRTPHEPLAGQMNMEQAIEKGREWMAAMIAQQLLPAQILEENLDQTTARLCTVETTKDIDIKPSLLSMWQVEYYLKEKVDVILTIHAVSGVIWKAQIDMRQSQMSYLERSNEEILDAAFSSLVRENDPCTDEGSKSYKKRNNGGVYALIDRMGYSRGPLRINGREVLPAEEDEVERIYLWLGTTTEKEPKY